MKHYDIFISYRRSSYDTANLIATRLRAAGYSVFFDMETLRSGKFNEQLFDVIDHCKDFVLVLPPDALERCVNMDDWVRLEVTRAMAGKKNIVPVMLNGFVWPDPMPVGMEELANYQALTATSTEYFDMAMERLQKRYLHSRRNLAAGRILRYGGAVAAILVAIIAILWAVFGVLSRDVCLKYATLLTKDAECVYAIVDENHNLAESWEEFKNVLNYESRPERVAQMQQEMLERIDLARTNLKLAWLSDSVKLEIPPYHGFLLSLHRINSEEIAISPQLATMHYTDYIQQLDALRTAVEEPDAMNLRYATVLFEVFEHSANGYYASVLSELSLFPSKSRTLFNELSPNWIYFPIQLYKIDESQKYYENIIITESRLAEEVMSRFDSYLEQQDAALEDIDRKNQELERQMDQNYAEISKQIEESAQVMQQVAQLQELEREFVELYDRMKVKCTFGPDEDQWDKWGKIVHWGSFLARLAEDHKEYEAEGMTGFSSVTPEKAYADMNTLLEMYQTSHPESREYVAAAKLFYKEVSSGIRPYAGVIVMVFKDDLKHPFLEKGDILTGYGDRQIMDYDDFKAAYKADKTSEVTFLRLVNGRFVEHQEKISDTDIVGFGELTE